MHITFDETVNVSSFVTTQLRLQNNDTAVSQDYTLAGSTLASLNDSTSLTVVLDARDLNSIKYRSRLATAVVDTFLFLGVTSIYDMNRNVYAYRASGLIASQYIVDVTQPELVSFDLDIDSAQLTLTFTEVIQASDIDVRQLVLRNEKTSSAQSSTLNITAGSVSGTVLSPGHPPVLTVSILPDINQLKFLDQLAVSKGSTFLTFSSDFTSDMATNRIRAIFATSAHAVRNFTPDTTKPRMSAFDVDLTAETLTLLFDETVDVSTVDVTQITLQNTPGHTTARNLTTSTVTTTSDGLTVVIAFSRDDLDFIKLDTALCTSRANCHLSINSDAVLDMAQNNLTAISDSTAQQVRTFTEDKTPPQLLLFSLDMDRATVKLLFSEPVDSATLNISQLTIQSAAWANTSNNLEPLSPGPSPLLTTSSSPNGVELTLQLGTEDLYNIQRKRQLATSSANAYIIMTSSAVSDMNSLPLVAVTNGNATQTTPSSFTADTHGPVLLRFDLDMDTNTLNLTWDEVVDASRFSIPYFTVQSLSDRSMAGNDSVYEEYMLKNLAAPPIVDSHWFSLQLSDTDMHQLKLLTNMATAASNTVLRAQMGGIVDLSAAKNPSVSRVLNVTSFRHDFTSPQVTLFSADLNTGRLFIDFDEPVDVATINFTQITLSNAATPTTSLQLTGGSTDSSSGLQVVVNLTIVDLNNLKRNDQLFHTTASTYLQVTSSFIRDMIGNKVAPLSPKNAASFTADTTDPTLVSFSFDNNVGLLSLLLTETMDVSTIDFTQITLQKNHDSHWAGDIHRLTGGRLNSTHDDIYVHILLSHHDHNELKRKRIGDAATNTWLVMSSSTIRDMNSNPVIPVQTNHSARQAQTYTPDTTMPSLTAFWLDLTSEELTLSFSETVEALKLQVDEITLVSASDSYTLTRAASSTRSPDGTSLVVDLGLDDLNEIKRKPGLAVNKATTLLSLTAQAVQDMVGNDIVNVTIDQPLAATNYTRDSINPVLEYYRLDLTNETLLMHFSETVNASSFSVVELRLQNAVGGGSQSYKLTGGTVGADSPDLTLALTEEDLNEIKKLTALATRKQNTFLSFSARMVSDMAANSIDSIASSLAQNVQRFTADAVAPQLRSFNLSMDSALVELSFTETVAISSLTPQAITFINTANGSATHTLQGGQRLGVDGPILQFRLTIQDLNRLKEIDALAVSGASTAIFFTSSLAMDMNTNSVVSIDLLSAVQVDTFTPDTTPPSIVAFHLDMNSGILWTTWDETVRSSSFKPEQFIFQNASPPKFLSALNLTGGNVSDADSTVVSVTLLDVDLNDLKRRPQLTTRVNDTFLFFPRTALTDMNSNMVQAVLTAGKQADNHTPDTTRPRLVSFTLNLTTEILELTYDEVIMATSFDIREHTLHSDRTMLATSHRLGQGTVLTVDDTRLRIRLSLNDLNTLKFLPLATGTHNTFLSFTKEAVSDMNNNEVIAVLPGQAAQADDFGADKVQPRLLRFNIDISTFTLTLFFSETVNATTMLVPTIGFQNLANSSSSMATILPLSVLSASSLVNNPTLTITISTPDMNEMKRLRNLATSRQDTYLTVSYGGVLDMNGNPLVAITTQSSLQVTNFTADTVKPTLVVFDLIMVGGKPPLIMELEFIETVLASTLKPTSILLSNSANASLNANDTYRLTGGSVHTMDSTHVNVTVTDFDLEEIRQRDAFALWTQPDSAYLAIDDYAVQDMAGNNLTGLALNKAVQIRNGQMSRADLQPPILQHFDVDLDAGVLHLAFSEAVNDSTILVKRLVLHNSAVGGVGENRFRITGSKMISSSANNEIVHVHFTDGDLNEIKRRTGLFINNASSFLSIERGLLLDFSENEAIVIPESTPQQVNTFTQDTTSPQILNFALDTDAAIFTLTFSETVNASSLDITQFTFQNESSSQSGRPTRSYTLASSFVFPVADSTVLNINLTEADLNEVKRIELLATRADDTFLSVNAAGLRDMARNLLAPLSTSNAQNVTAFTGDSTRPYLRRAVFNLNTSHLTLTFDETVKQNTFDITQLTLQDAVARRTYWRRLTAAISSVEDSTIITLRVSDVDMNEVKRLPFCTATSNCFLTFSNDTVKDMARLPVTAKEDGAAHQVNILIPDLTQPELLQFTEFNLENETLTLLFSETVDVSTLDYTALTLQTLFEGPLSRVTLANGSVPARDTTVVVISLHPNDVDRIKLDQKVCARRGICYVTLSSALINDMNNNSVVPVVDSFPGQVVKTFVADRQPPRLIQFDLSMSTNVLTLYFDEPVLASSLTLTKITLQAERNSSSSNQVALTGGVFSTQNGKQLRIDLSADDVRTMKSRPFLKDANSTFLSLRVGAVTDMAFTPNAIEEIPSTSAIQVTNYTRDSLGPVVSAFQLDLTTDWLTLTFNQPIEPSTFRVTLINLTFPAAGSHTLQAGTLSSSSTSSGLTEITVVLQRPDLRELKLLAAIEQGTLLYLSAPAGLILDTDQDPAGAQIAVQGNLVIDASRATLESFTLDLNGGLISLTFTDVMRATPFKTESVTIQSTRTLTPSISYTLSSSSQSSVADGYTVNITLSQSDLDTLKSMFNLATAVSNTYITMLASTINDVLSRDVIAVTDGKAVQASQVWPDTTAPTLLDFGLDLNTGSLLLTFSEAVQHNTLNRSQLTLLSSQDTNASSLVLSTSSNSSMQSLTDIRVVLTDKQLDNLKANTGLGTETTNTFLSIQPGAIRDTSKFGVIGINESFALQASSVVPDTTAPQLVRFDLDMDVGNVATLLLEFSETVNSSSLDVSQISIHGSGTRTMVANTLRLSEGQSRSINHASLVITLVLNDVNKTQTADNGCHATIRHFHLPRRTQHSGHELKLGADDPVREWSLPGINTTGHRLHHRQSSAQDRVMGYRSDTWYADFVFQ